jgi:hypothetical protein
VLRRAAAVVTASGVSGELGSPRADSAQTTSPPTAVGQNWSVIYPRVFRGIPYAGQHVRVSFQGSGGQLQVFAINFPSSLPPQVRETVTREQAVRTAAAMLRQKDFGEPVFVQAEKVIVQPTTIWENGDSQPRSTFSRIAWNCLFSTDRRTIEVWVDIENGRVIGGDVAGNRR